MASRQWRPSELAADLIVHIVGIAAGIVGAAVIVLLAVRSGNGLVLAASSVYAAGLVLMLSCSATYNIASNSRYAERLRRFDHAAIFIMIAGTYTPYTICRLGGAWAVGLTAAEWTGALAGAAMKLIRPRHSERLSLLAYLALGWLFLVAAGPVYAAISGQSFAFLAAGGALYMTGLAFYRWRSLPYHNAIWHVFVAAAAVCHYFSILDGVVLAAGR